jgi:hypothetical protein
VQNKDLILAIELSQGFALVIPAGGSYENRESLLDQFSFFRCEPKIMTVGGNPALRSSEIPTGFPLSMESRNVVERIATLWKESGRLQASRLQYGAISRLELPIA